MLAMLEHGLAIWAPMWTDGDADVAFRKSRVKRSLSEAAEIGAASPQSFQARGRCNVRQRVEQRWPSALRRPDVHASPHLSRVLDTPLSALLHVRVPLTWPTRPDGDGPRGCQRAGCLLGKKSEVAFSAAPRSNRPCPTSGRTRSCQERRAGSLCMPLQKPSGLQSITKDLVETHATALKHSNRLSPSMRQYQVHAASSSQPRVEHVGFPESSRRT